LRQTQSFSWDPNKAAQEQGFKQAAYPFYSPSDGCSGGISARGMRRFDASCRLHDECYRVGDHTRIECDRIFLNAMQAKCAELSEGFEPVCNSEASLMYDAVRVWSGDIFTRRKKNQLRYEEKLLEKLSPLLLAQKQGLSQPRNPVGTLTLTD
jgi:hypothetical protein